MSITIPERIDVGSTAMVDRHSTTFWGASSSTGGLAVSNNFWPSSRISNGSKSPRDLGFYVVQHKSVDAVTLVFIPE